MAGRHKTWKPLGPAGHHAIFTFHTCIAGDVERDFWLAYDLLQNPKDHAEFTIVRNWVQKALEVGHLMLLRLKYNTIRQHGLY